MKKFIVTGKPLTLKTGTLQLTKDQAASRGYCLQPVKKKQGIYEVTGEACFKVGEVIGYDGPDYKRLMNAGLVDVEAKSRTSEVGGQKSEVGGRKSEVGRLISDF